MRKLLLLAFVVVVKVSVGQYCGSSSPNICIGGGLSAPGISDYTTFPCVNDSVPYSEVIQIYFPSTYLYDNVNIPIDTVILDSITNLPCGLCWSCNSPNFIYQGGSLACLLISGTTNDVQGAYQVSIYGTILTPYGILSGTLDNLGFQFFLNVVGKDDPCDSINIQQLHNSCSPLPVNCNLDVALGTNTPVTNCTWDSMEVHVTQPLGPGYVYEWAVLPDFYDSTSSFSDTLVTLEYYTPSVEIYPSDLFIDVYVYDSVTGCVEDVPLSVLAGAGVAYFPTICYTTADSSQANSNSLAVVFEKDDWFGSLAGYEVTRQDLSGPNPALNPIGYVPANAPGIVTDTAPISGYQQFYDGEHSVYCLSVYSACSADSLISGGFFGFYTPSVLFVDTNGVGVQGYPFLVWNNSSNMNYSTVYIFSRIPGGNWRLRFSTSNLNDTTWLDQQPDSTKMEYMLGFALTTDCDPNRSANHTAFSSFSGTPVSPVYVVADSATSTPTGFTAVSKPTINVVIYPNPVSDKLYLQVTNATALGALTYKIYDMMGRQVAGSALATNDKNIIDVSVLPGGVYSMSLVSCNGQQVVKRFVKQ